MIGLLCVPVFVRVRTRAEGSWIPYTIQISPAQNRRKGVVDCQKCICADITKSPYSRPSDTACQPLLYLDARDEVEEANREMIRKIARYQSQSPRSSQVIPTSRPPDNSSAYKERFDGKLAAYCLRMASFSRPYDSRTANRANRSAVRRGKRAMHGY